MSSFVVDSILDINPRMVNKTPYFLEVETNEALKNLNINESDLVPVDLKDDYEPPKTPVSKMNVFIELERQRLNTIQQVINERNRLVSINKNKDNKYVQKSLSLMNDNLSALSGVQTKIQEPEDDPSFNPRNSKSLVDEEKIEPQEDEAEQEVEEDKDTLDKEAIEQDSDAIADLYRKVQPNIPTMKPNNKLKEEMDENFVRQQMCYENIKNRKMRQYLIEKERRMKTLYKIPSLKPLPKKKGRKSGSNQDGSDSTYRSYGQSSKFESDPNGVPPKSLAESFSKSPKVIIPKNKAYNNTPARRSFIPRLVNS